IEPVSQSFKKSNRTRSSEKSNQSFKKSNRIEPVPPTEIEIEISIHHRIDLLPHVVQTPTGNSYFQLQTLVRGSGHPFSRPIPLTAPSSGDPDSRPPPATLWPAIGSFQGFIRMGLSKTEINLRRLLAAAPQQQHQAKLIHYVGTLREQLEQLAAERTSEGLPSPPSTVEGRVPKSVDATDSTPIKLDAAAQTHISKHRKLQEDLTDEMVGLAQQLKESTLMMNQSIKNTEKSLASTGRANTQAMAIYSETSKTSCFTWLVMLLMTCIFIMVVLLIKVT
ncbi:hypothetical protein Ccrd_009193, partial [Cynara cardunculus var. scolymus]